MDDTKVKMKVDMGSCAGGRVDKEVEYPSNSLKSRSKTVTEKEEPPKKVDKIICGNVVK